MKHIIKIFKIMYYTIIITPIVIIVISHYLLKYIVNKITGKKEKWE